MDHPEDTPEGREKARADVNKFIQQSREQRRQRIERNQHREQIRRRIAEHGPTNEEEALQLREDQERERRQIEEMSPQRISAFECRRRIVGDVDLVSAALDRPHDLGWMQHEALLGRTPFEPDATAFLESLSGYKAHKRGSFSMFLGQISDTSTSFRSAELCKFALCDRRIPDGFRAHGDDNVDANTAVEDLYKEQLRLECDHDSLERAREAVRSDSEKRSRHFARRMLDAFESALDKGEVPDPDKIWGEMRPRRAEWVRDIFNSRDDYGFIFFLTKEVVQGRSVAFDRWSVYFHGKRDDDAGRGVGFHRGAESIDHGSGLAQYMAPGWVTDLNPSETDPGAMRRLVTSIMAKGCALVSILT